MTNPTRPQPHAERSAHTIRLTDAQVSALECRGLEHEETLDSNDRVLARCWNGGGAIVFADSEREALFDALIDAANAEDFSAESGDVFARRAAVSLSAVAGKVLRCDA